MPGGWRALASGLSLLALLMLAGGCEQRAGALPRGGLLLPGLANSQDKLDRVQLRGPGHKVLVTLARQRGSWLVAERNGWPADAGRLSQFLFQLAQARRAEVKTSNPALYARLGVQPVSDAGASGTELTLSAGKSDTRIVIGHEHDVLDANYVRIEGQAQAWLTDVPIAFDPDPVAWLDHRLVDLPLARVAKVSIQPRIGPSFTLSSRDDRFRLDDAPSAAMRESHQGDAIASVPDQLRLEDVLLDDGAAKERELRYDLVDGSSVTLQLWHVGEQSWIRLAAALDEGRLAEWTRLGGKPQSGSEVRQRVLAWNRRFDARRFLLADKVAAILMLDHDQILAGTPSP